MHPVEKNCKVRMCQTDLSRLRRRLVLHGLWCGCNIWGLLGLGDTSIHLRDGIVALRHSSNVGLGRQLVLFELGRLLSSVVAWLLVERLALGIALLLLLGHLHPARHLKSRPGQRRGQCSTSAGQFCKQLTVSVQPACVAGTKVTAWCIA